MFTEAVAFMSVAHTPTSTSLLSSSRSVDLRNLHAFPLACPPPSSALDALSLLSFLGLSGCLFRGIAFLGALLWAPSPLIVTMPGALLLSPAIVSFWRQCLSSLFVVLCLWSSSPFPVLVRACGALGLVRVLLLILSWLVHISCFICATPSLAHMLRSQWQTSVLPPDPHHGSPRTETGHWQGPAPLRTNDVDSFCAKTARKRPHRPCK